jgi:hypothetical protein
MGLLDSLRKALGDSGGSGGDVHWIYARCGRCGEPLAGRVDLRNEPSLADDGETWIVRKGLVGSGHHRAGTAPVLRCYQVVEVTLRFDTEKRNVIDREAAGGALISKEEYDELKGAAGTHA